MTPRLAAPQGALDRAWLAARLQLWPQVTHAEHLRDMADALARGHFIRLAFAADDAPVGLAEAALRRDYVNGTTSSPVAFLEGLFVAPDARRQGVARARSWTRSRRGPWRWVAASLPPMRCWRTPPRTRCTARSVSQRPSGWCTSGGRCGERG